jgi:hypothetical protein
MVGSKQKKTLAEQGLYVRVRARARARARVRAELQRSPCRGTEIKHCSQSVLVSVALLATVLYWRMEELHSKSYLLDTLSVPELSADRLLLWKLIKMEGSIKRDFKDPHAIVAPNQYQVALSVLVTL